MESVAWKFLADVGDHLGKPVDPSMESLVVDYWMNGVAAKKVAEIIATVEAEEERKAYAQKAFLKASN